MATREFDAKFLYDLVKKAQAGVPLRIEQAWADAFRDHNYPYRVEQVEKHNKSWLTRAGFRKPKTIAPFEEWIETRKTEDNHGWLLDWKEHKGSYRDQKTFLAKVLNIAQENEKAGKDVRVTDDEYNTILFYANPDL